MFVVGGRRTNRFKPRRIDKGDPATTVGIVKVKNLDIASHRFKVVADLDAGIACEELDELKRAFLEVSVSKVCERWSHR